MMSDQISKENKKGNYKPGLLRDVDKELVSSLSDLEKIALTRDGYDRVAEDWDKTRQNLWPELLSEIEKYIIPKSKILDLGCGNGRLIKDINKFEIDYTGIDISDALIKIAREKYDEHSFPKIKLATFDGLALNNKTNTANVNFDNETFDQVISIAVLHHLPPAKVIDWLKEANRVTKSGSINIFTTWNLSESNYDLNENGDAVIGFIHHKNTRYVHYYNHSEIKDIFTQSGFEILEIKEVKRESGMSNTLIIARKI